MFAGAESVLRALAVGDLPGHGEVGELELGGAVADALFELVVEEAERFLGVAAAAEIAMDDEAGAPDEGAGERGGGKDGRERWCARRIARNRNGLGGGGAGRR